MEIKFYNFFDTTIDKDIKICYYHFNNRVLGRILLGLSL